MRFRGVLSLTLHWEESLQSVIGLKVSCVKVSCDYEYKMDQTEAPNCRLLARSFLKRA